MMNSKIKFFLIKFNKGPKGDRGEQGKQGLPGPKGSRGETGYPALGRWINKIFINTLIYFIIIKNNEF